MFDHLPVDAGFVRTESAGNARLSVSGLDMTPQQCGPLDIEIISEEFIVMLRQLSYAIKNHGSLWHKNKCISVHGATYPLKAPKAPYYY